MNILTFTKLVVYQRCMRYAKKTELAIDWNGWFQVTCLDAVENNWLFSGKSPKVFKKNKKAIIAIVKQITSDFGEILCLKK